jgi:pimeloyl-ACP methyl ester carboxylesterase
MERFGPSMAALEPLVDPRFGVGHEFTSSSSTMLIAFAAMSTVNPPPFHFFEFTSGLPIKRLFVRDPASIWYQRGVPGFGDTIDEVAASLKSIVDEQAVERLIVVGSSAGGYAALAFGSLLQADIVLSFAPQSSLDRAWLDELGDHRWAGAFKTLDALGGPDPRWIDLREALPRESHGGTVYEVHHPTIYEGAPHAERLEGLPGVTVIGHARGYHNFLANLRKSGELTEIFHAAGVPVRGGSGTVAL